MSSEPNSHERENDESLSPMTETLQTDSEGMIENEPPKPVVKPQTASGKRLKGKGLSRFKVSQSRTDKGPSIANHDASDDKPADAD
ncbi:hypothetical protein [Endozoicomonas montiporae]|uniref:Uncharacterized protein n=1 Tax=Endozoicomonas montiporae CL-33 TaxID=570277 RepID=A0A142BI67_9GAMM|nr:hypothetical protein [Endozoicomonas montiporae]AMO58443.1 hypothetical protein EZMO1_4531 [Endozoicomonas montiporae CL-33]